MDALRQTWNAVPVTHEARQSLSRRASHAFVYRPKHARMPPLTLLCSQQETLPNYAAVAMRAPSFRRCELLMTMKRNGLFGARLF
jgi:hypothetical protein